MQNKKITKLKQAVQGGFTLIELMIVVGIIAIISVLVLFNSSKLNSSILLSNTAYEIGLIVRDAQVSGLGAKVISTGGVATTSNQGVYFDMDTPTKVIFFADLNKNGKYNVGEESQVYSIDNKRSGKILSICKVNNDPSLPTNCSNTTTLLANNILGLNIVFKRPNPEAYFNYYDYSDSSKTNAQVYNGSVVVNVGFTGGECKSIIMYKTGAIQIDQSFCN